jgi:hypothetical protein
MSRASECETEDLGISDGGKGARSCEDLEDDVQHSKQAQLVLYKNPSNILPGSGGRYTVARKRVASGRSDSVRRHVSCLL